MKDKAADTLLQNLWKIKEGLDPEEAAAWEALLGKDAMDKDALGKKLREGTREKTVVEKGKYSTINRLNMRPDLGSKGMEERKREFIETWLSDVLGGEPHQGE